MSPARRIRRDLVLVLAFALAGFFGCLAFVRVGGIYLSPDETANAFFAGQFARTGALSAYDALNVDLGDALHPRSVLSLSGRLVPGSFTGLPVVYGIVAAAAGGWTTAFLTPLLALVAVFAWYGVVRRLFDREIALYASVLLAIHPAWWYYSARSLMHNVPFAALLIFAAYFFVARPLRGRKWARADLLCAGLCLGVALWFRTSEIAWIAIASVAALAAFRPRVVSWRSAALFVAGVAVALTPLFMVNRETYGGAFVTGYTAGEKTAEAGVGTKLTEGTNGATLTVPSVPFVFSLFLPFGFSLPDIRANVIAYGFELAWWMSALVVLGIPLAVPTRAVAREFRRPRWAYLAFSAVAAVLLAVSYGSWTFFDNPDPTQVTIGNSHVRYWIPAFVLSTPFAAYAVRWISRRAFTDLARRLAVAAVLCVSLALSVRAVFFSTPDALAHAADRLEVARDIRARALSIVEPEAVVVVDRADKLFFPYRRVRYPLRDEETYVLLPRIARRVPLYYYGITLPPQDLDWLNDVKLAASGLLIEPVEEFGEESLYRIGRRE